MADIQATVIVPVYNTEKYVGSCIESIVNQSFSDWELLLIDDGSTDSSRRVCEEYSRNDIRIRTIHKSNGGPSSCRNLGILQAKGQYILFCDSDDQVDSFWIEKLVSEAKRYPNALIVCGYIVIDEEGQTKSLTNHNKGYYQKSSYYDHWDQMGSSCNKIFLKSILVDNSIRFDESVFFGEDILFVLEYLKQVEGYYLIGEVLYKYHSYQNTSRQTLSNRGNYYQQKRIYNARLPFVKASQMEEFNSFYFCLIWDRFTKLTNRPIFVTLSDDSELKDLIKDEVFQRKIVENGVFDNRSRTLLSKGRIKTYCILQSIHTLFTRNKQHRKEG